MYYKFCFLSSLMIHSSILMIYGYPSIKFNVEHTRANYTKLYYVINQVQSAEEVSKDIFPRKTIVEDKIIKNLNTNSEKLPQVPKSTKSDNDIYYLSYEQIHTVQDQSHYNEPLHYPIYAIRRLYEGDLVLIIYLNHEGMVEEIHISESTGFLSLDEAAINTIKTWKFDLTKINHAQSVKLPIKFKLTK